MEGRLYLPEDWAGDPARCEKANIPPGERVFKTKSRIALEMILTQRARGVRFGWVGMDAGYGKDPGLLRALESAGEIFVAGVHSNHRLPQCYREGLGGAPKS